ncbi:MAG: hypothetical protein A3C11_00195 [Candidatus Sungbacteria bacterium RIFCSPHIGHO2_02_FULL_49_12]|uniref:Uncharacterized protein n=1 Tax=Candidatus Sungbacteria bacterium RIFCSPHIGHO2_02_FULL_49_12 TaxID=1802271 RepID=A0A1G2KQW8_9BACT|nr:MAG: hypothetical protein A3C11_00195 [Candidatus Sungbacteria bacterium RIFCSPHIGHO2_02_FULL_49_12]
MDIVAHALWSGAIYNKKRVWWAVFFGVAPDLFSFGIFTVGRLLSGRLFSPAIVYGDIPRHLVVPTYVHALYDVTHSVLIWAVLFSIGWFYFQRIPWEFTAWALHIVIDIPTHSLEFFPTPFLWPLPQPFFIDGTSWATPWFLVLNYAAIAGVYICVYVRKLRLKKMPGV